MLNFMYNQSYNPIHIKTKRSEGVRACSHRKRLLKVKRPNTEKFKKSLAYKGPKSWNMLAETYHQAQTKDAFKVLVSQKVSLRMKKDIENKA